MMGTKAFAQCDRRKAATTVPLNFIVSFLLFVWGTVYLFTGIYIYIYIYIYICYMGDGDRSADLSLSVSSDRSSQSLFHVSVCMYVCVYVYVQAWVQ